MFPCHIFIVEHTNCILFYAGINSCSELNPPNNGALACDTWLDGRFCQILCQENYVLNGKDSSSNLLICGDSGTWYGTTSRHCEGTALN